MKILRLRTSTPINELKGEQFWVADAHTKLAMLPCGHFVITRFDKHVLVPHGRVDSCAVEPDKSAIEQHMEEAAYIAARLPMEPLDIPMNPDAGPARRKPGRPPKAPSV